MQLVMSALGQKRTGAAHKLMSALCHKRTSVVLLTWELWAYKLYGQFTLCAL
jgi:hypothetical protein